MLPYQLCNYFNPRTRVGCDRKTQHCRYVGRHFNPRTRVGCDERFVSPKDFIRKFQSTHPCRVRRFKARLGLFINHFNPRTRVGCDQARAKKPLLLPIFQSTHPCRVRPTLVSNQSQLCIFQSTHPCRVRQNRRL